MHVPKRTSQHRMPQNQNDTKMPRTLYASSAMQETVAVLRNSSQKHICQSAPASTAYPKIQMPPKCHVRRTLPCAMQDTVVSSPKSLRRHTWRGPPVSTTYPKSRCHQMPRTVSSAMQDPDFASVKLPTKCQAHRTLASTMRGTDLTLRNGVTTHQSTRAKVHQSEAHTPNHNFTQMQAASPRHAGHFAAQQLRRAPVPRCTRQHHIPQIKMAPKCRVHRTLPSAMQLTSAMQETASFFF